MISYLRGTIIAKQDSAIVLDVNGVGYEVLISSMTREKVADINHNATLLIHMIVREDAHLLYGFSDESERQLFRALIKVNGIGPKLALTILSGISVNSFVHCVQQKDVTQLTGIPGIGKKTAERLLVEIRDAISDLIPANPILPMALEPISEHQSVIDAMSALASLGYKSYEAKLAIKQIQNRATQTEDLIRLALQQLHKGVQ